MRSLLVLLTLSWASAASAQTDFQDQPMTIERSGYVCTAVGSGPLGYSSFEATASDYPRAYYLALARCQLAHGYGERTEDRPMGNCRVTQCDRVL